MKCSLLFVFLISGFSWSQNQLGDPFYGNQEGDRLGYALAASDDGSIVAVTKNIKWSEEPEERRKGSVSVYKNENGVWQTLGNTIVAANSGSSFGQSVSLSADGKIVAIGNDYTLDDDNLGAVQIYTYDEDSDSWNQLGSTIQGKESSEHFGISVSLSQDGQTLAIGAAGAQSSAGLARVYKFQEGEWNQMGEDILGVVNTGNNIGDYFGKSLALSASGETLVVGAYNYDTDFTNSGMVKVYSWDVDTWMQKGSTITGGNYEQLGFSVSISSNGEKIAIASPSYRSGSQVLGSVLVYYYKDDWTILGERVAGASAQGQFGYAVSLSGAGDVFVVGDARINASSGEVLAFKYDNGSWKQIGKTSGPETPSSGYGYGWSVALSRNGKTFVAGSINYGNNDLEEVGYASVNDISQLLSTNETALGHQGLLYPNPASDIVKLHRKIGLKGISVYTITGQKITDFTTPVMDVSSLVAGIYIFKIKIGDKEQIEKVVIQ